MPRPASATKLKNGSQLIMIPIKSAHSLVSMAISGSGPRFDPKGKEGLSHFTEHMLFKGSKKWPTSYELTRALEEKGAYAEAYSYYESNKYWVHSPTEAIDTAIENLLERIHNSLVKEEAIQTEKGVVKEELRLVENNPEKLIWELWSQALWTNLSLGRSYVGTEKSISSFSAQDVRKFINTYYHPKNIVYLLSGNFSISKAKNIFEKYLSRKTSNQNHNNQTKKQKNNKANIIINKREFDNILLAIGFPTVKYGHPDMVILELLVNILAGGFSSRLRQKIMEPGYTYSINGYTLNLSDTGYIMFTLSTTKKDLKKVLNILYEELSTLASEQVSDKELELVKNYSIGTLEISIETPLDWIDYYANQYLYQPKKIVHLEELALQIRKITPNQVQKAALKYFSPNFLNIAAIGNIVAKDIPRLT